MRDVLVAAKIAPEGQKLSRVNLLEIEKALRENPYLMSANCYYTDKGVLCIDVTPRKPILLVMASNGQRYYLDEKGSTMPANRFCLPLCVATGNITKEYAACCPWHAFSMPTNSGTGRWNRYTWRMPTM